MESVVFDIIGNGNQIVIGEACTLNSITFFIRGDNHRIQIGKNCRFSNGGNLWMEDTGGQLEIGDQCSFVSVLLAVTEPDSKIIIGNDCMFASDIDVRTGDSHAIIDLETNERINPAKNVTIGNQVWVAAHCIILKGVNIPDNSVIASGSVVTRYFSKTSTIIGGNPAKVIKQGIRWSRNRHTPPGGS